MSWGRGRRVCRPGRRRCWASHSDKGRGCPRERGWWWRAAGRPGPDGQCPPRRLDGLGGKRLLLGRLSLFSAVGDGAAQAPRVSWLLAGPQLQMESQGAAGTWGRDEGSRMKTAPASLPLPLRSSAQHLRPPSSLRVTEPRRFSKVSGNERWRTQQDWGLSACSLRETRARGTPAQPARCAWEPSVGPL